MPLARLVASVPEVALHGDGGLEVRGIRLDSRRVEAGDLFAALAGRRDNGRRFVRQAVDRGAVAVLSAPPRPDGARDDVAWLSAEMPRRALGNLCRSFFGAPDARLAVVGITGTDGKTSTAAMLAAALESAGMRAATAGTLGQSLGDDVRPAGLTTPEAPDLWPFLARCADSGIAAVALEASSAALAADRLSGMRFAAAVLTGVGRDHLDVHGTLTAYRAAKRRLFQMLPGSGLAVLPSALSYSDFRSSTSARIVTYGEDAEADWRVEKHEPHAEGARFVLRGPGGFERGLATRRPGPWDALNLAAAVATAHGMGADPARAAEGAAALSRVPGRWEVVDEGQPWLAIVDYAHTPEALERVLALLGRLVRGRVICVFGCGGDRDRGKRSEMGRVAVSGAALVIVTDDNPRGEDPEAIAREVLEGTHGTAARAEYVAGRECAISRAVGMARLGDAVLVAGKGHEVWQEIGGERLPFDDRDRLREAILALGARP